MVYDGLGRRITRQEGSATARYHYDTEDRLIAISDDSGNWTETIWLEDLPVAQATGGSLVAIHTDQIGQPARMTNSSGAIVWSRMAQPFGETYAESGAIATVLRFPGQVADAATQTHYNMARDYDPSLGRYLQSDPIGLDGGWNTYGYVEGNPISQIDPEGLDYKVRPDEWISSGPFGLIAYVRDRVTPALSGEKVCIDYGGMARDMLVTAGLGATGGILFKYGYDVIRGLGPALLRNGSNLGNRVGAQGALAAESEVAGGLIYLRIDTNGKLAPYIGKTTEANELARQGAHARAFPNSKFEFETLESGIPIGSQLDIAEHNAIQARTGGVAARRSSAVSNQRDPVGPNRRPAFGLPEPR